MAAKRHRLAQRRKTVGFTQEGLAEKLAVDPTTVRRWESGETGPQPWLRPKLARYLRVSAEQLDELLSADADERESLPGSVTLQPSNVPVNAEILTLDRQLKVFFQVTVNGRLVLVSLDGNTDASNWETISPANRRLVLGYGLAAAAASALGADEAAAHALERPAVPLTLSVPVPAATSTSWAKGTYEAVLNPMDAARRAAATLDALDESMHDLNTLRVAADRAMHVSLSSDYGALEQSLPTLIGCVAAATMQPHRNEDTAHLLAAVVSDVYAVVSWTLIKTDIALGAWIAAQRAIQAAEEIGDVLRVAAATRCLAEVHMRAKNFEEATRTALLAAVHAESAPPENRTTAVALRGASVAIQDPSWRE
ncbi:MAG TPA: helix-turn-helix transcriptional regulator [Pseudonocardiaceae bacterium]|jgi:DNA-binding XRE family transcriptional regulator|nr:helix-turn-helix transcriptional regulator [Pseudonocardiaceae bacterium]